MGTHVRRDRGHVFSAGASGSQYRDGFEGPETPGWLVLGEEEDTTAHPRSRLRKLGPRMRQCQGTGPVPHQGLQTPAWSLFHPSNPGESSHSELSTQISPWPAMSRPREEVRHPGVSLVSNPFCTFSYSKIRYSILSRAYL